MIRRQNRMLKNDEDNSYMNPDTVDNIIMIELDLAKHRIIKALTDRRYLKFDRETKKYVKS